MYPWDRRGEVYIRYGEPDYRSTSDRLNADMPAKAQRIKERMAVDLYGPDAVGEFFTGPVYPVRSTALSDESARSQGLGLNLGRDPTHNLLERRPGADEPNWNRVQACRHRSRYANCGQEQALAALGDVNTRDLSFPPRVRRAGLSSNQMGFI